MTGYRAYKKRLVATARFTAVATLIGAAIGYMLARIDEQPVKTIVFASAISGCVLGAVLGACEEFLVRKWGKTMSFVRLNLARVSFNTAAIFGVVIASNVIRMAIDYGYGPTTAVAVFFRESGPRDLVIVVVVAAFVTAAFELRQLYPPIELWHLLSGRYFNPVTEDRVVLFADLIGSTGIAETLGPVRYSHFIRDLFADLSDPIIAWNGTVLQYAGDGLIVTWPRKRGLSDGACIWCFLEMHNTLLAQSAYFESTYNTRPNLRGGIHAGSVVVTRVGETRSAMTYVGDAMNVAARLQALCRERETDLLVSEPVHAAVDNPDVVGLKPVGEVNIRGRSEGMKAFALTARL